MATLMMEAARLLGVAARFASGYLHGTRIAGRPGVDPRLGRSVFADAGLARLRSDDRRRRRRLSHIVTGVSTHPRGVMPVSGAFTGGSADYLELHVTVKTTPLDGQMHVTARSTAFAAHGEFSRGFQSTAA